MWREHELHVGWFARCERLLERGRLFREHLVGW
jgi:hypothetical protein